MTNLDKNQKNSVNGLKARKAAYDEQLVKLQEEFDRVKTNLQVDLAQGALDAMAAGVPQSRISMEAFGYNQANGIRSLFGLPMRGSIVEHLKVFIKGHGNMGGGMLNMGDFEPAVVRTEPIIYEGEPWDGFPVWIIERPDGEILKFADGMGATYWQGRKNRFMTEEEVALLETKLPNNGVQRTWQFDPYNLKFHRD